jgi:hypothetical protein
MVLFKNARDNVQIESLARQMFPRKVKFLVDAFEDATAKPYGYLMVDLRPETQEDRRIMTNIFPNEETIVYVPGI